MVLRQIKRGEPILEKEFQRKNVEVSVKRVIRDIGEVGLCVRVKWVDGNRAGKRAFALRNPCEYNWETSFCWCFSPIGNNRGKSLVSTWRFIRENSCAGIA